MDYQVLFNLAIGAAGLFGGYVLTRIYNAIDKLDDDVRKIPLNYVQKDDFKTAMSELKTDLRSGFQQIDKTLNVLFERLNEKADKS